MRRRMDGGIHSCTRAIESSFFTISHCARDLVLIHCCVLVVVVTSALPSSHIELLSMI